MNEIKRLQQLAGINEIKINPPNLPNQQNDDFIGIEEFESDYPNLNFLDIVKKLNNAGYKLTNNEYYDGALDLEKNPESSYYCIIGDGGDITIYGDSGEEVERL